VEIQWNASTGFNALSSDVGLFLPTGNFTSPSAMLSFFQYGAGQQGRENVAVAAGIWTVNTFFTGSGPWIYTGNGLDQGPDFWTVQGTGGGIADVVINEVDARTGANENEEFIELIGLPGASLNGIVVVLFDGTSPSGSSYAAFDLEGYAFNENGFLVIGNTAVPSTQILFPDNFLSNGPAAVALYQGNDSDWPDGSLPSVTSLVDAIVYGPSGSAHDMLLNTLTPGQPLVIESTPGANQNTSLSRLPDGGAPFLSSAFVNHQPTPGSLNANASPPCLGGTIQLSESQLPNLCLEEPNAPLFFFFNDAIGEESLIVALDEDGLIVRIAENGELNFNGLPAAIYSVAGAQYSGEVTGLEIGSPFGGVSASGCLATTTNSIDVTLFACAGGECSGGLVSANGGFNYLTVCLDGSADLIMMSTTSTSSAFYSWFVTTEANIIVQHVPNPFNADLFLQGTYRIWGVSHSGSLDPPTIIPGNPLSEITSGEECIQLSSNFIQLIALVCSSGEGCTELFISEYIEGIGNNKALEIFNPTPFPVNLSGYGIYVFNNGSTEFNSAFGLSGVLPALETYVVVNPLAGEDLISVANAVSTVANFNGNDAIQLRFLNTVLDQIGVVGQNPGIAWTFGSGGSTADKVLVRRDFVNSPSTNWTQSTGQWDVYPPTDFSHLGAHEMIPCQGTEIVGFSTPGLLVDESIGTVTITINAFGIQQETQVTVSLVGGTATPDLDFVNIFPLPLTLPVGASSHSFDVQIIDDDFEEGTEFFQLGLSGPSPLSFNIQVITISILPNDPIYEYYPIESVKNINSQGILDSLEVFCELRGIVHGINFNSFGLHFHLIDQTGGIKAFRASGDVGYLVNEGDSIHVRGMINQFFGQAEIFPDEIDFISSNHPLRPPVITSTLNEALESLPVTVECVRIENPEGWSGATGGFFVQVSSAEGMYTVRIDGETELSAATPPGGRFTLTGIVEQLDEEPPFTEGYHIWPARNSDISNHVIASFVSFSTLEYTNEGAQIAIENTSFGASSYLWNFGDGAASDGVIGQHFYAYDFLESNPLFDISLIAIGGCMDTARISVNAINTKIEEHEFPHFTVYPNPARDILHILTDREIDHLTLFDLSGRSCAFLQPDNELHIVLPITNLSLGVYLLSIYTANGDFSVVRILKE